MMHFFPVAHLFDGNGRAEKDRSQFASENNDLRAAMDHMSSEKVLTGGRPKLPMLRSVCCMCLTRIITSHSTDVTQDT